MPWPSQPRFLLPFFLFCQWSSVLHSSGGFIHILIISTTSAHFLNLFYCFSIFFIILLSLIFLFFYLYFFPFFLFLCYWNIALSSEGYFFILCYYSTFFFLFSLFCCLICFPHAPQLLGSWFIVRDQSWDPKAGVLSPNRQSNWVIFPENINQSEVHILALLDCSQLPKNSTAGKLRPKTSKAGAQTHLSEKQKRKKTCYRWKSKIKKL